MQLVSDLQPLSPEVHVAKMMPPEQFNPYDCELPDVETLQFKGSVRLGTSRVNWIFETQERQLDEPDNIFPFYSGFGGVQFSSAPFRNALAQLGMGTLTLEPIRKCDRSIRERLFDPHKIHYEAMQSALEGLKVETGIVPSEEATGTKLVIMGHSMGGEPAVRHATNKTNETAAVILFATIGFGSPSVSSIARKIPGGIIPAITEEVVPFIQIPEVPKNINSLSRAVGYFMLNPMRTFGEIGSCLTSDLQNECSDLHNNGVDVVYAQPVYDLLVQGFDGAANAVSTVSRIERAGHMLIQAKPARAAHFVLGALQTTKLADVA